MTDSIKDAYDRIAPLFAERHAAMPEGLAALAARFLDLVGPEVRVLDVGCGAGRDMAWMEAHGAPVIGVDLSAGMLAQARRQVRGPLFEMDMRHLAFPDARFRGVWCIASLLHIPKREAPDVLREMRRVLASSGVLVLCLQEGTGEGWEPVPYDVPAKRFFARYRADEVEKMLVQAGFVILDHGSTGADGQSWLPFLAQKCGPGDE